MTTRTYRLGRRQATIDQTRARILKAARAVLVARRGGEFTIEAIAQRARVTRATVYQQFGSHAKLLEALFDDLAQQGGMSELRDAFTQPDPEKALALFIATFGRFWTAHRPIHRRLLALAALDPALDRTLRARQEWRRPGLRQFVARMQQGRAGGAAEDTVDLLFVLTSFQTFDMLAGATRTPADVVPLVVRAAKAALKGS